VRAAVLTGSTPVLGIQTIADPSPAAGEVVVEVAACGICGSDLHSIRFAAPPGTVMGHEFCGRIVGRGTGVSAAEWPDGKRVAVRPTTGCGNCAPCQAGRPDRCASFELIGFQRPGGFAEYTTAPLNELYAIPDSIDDLGGALIEPLAVARRAVRRGDLRRDESVLILGGGPIGAAVLLWAKNLGAGTVVVSDPSAERRAWVQDIGADATVDPTSDGLHAVPDLTGGAPGLVVECVGHPGLIQTAIEATGFEGRVVVAGVCIATDSIVPYFGLLKEVDVRFSMYYGREDYHDTIRELAHGALAAKALTSTAVGLDALPGVFDAQLEKPAAGKVFVQRTA